MIASEPKYTILHTESSTGWGGQEMRILKEALGMRERGHEILLAVVRGGKLVAKAREQGFVVYEIPYSKAKGFLCLYKLMQILRRHRVQIVNTHSSLDAWIAGIAARLSGRSILRTRHLSTPIRKGVNSVLLYRKLADAVVTTSSGIIPMIIGQSGLAQEKCRCIATGIEPSRLTTTPEEIEAFRREIGFQPGDFVVGTLCVLRSWKGINDFLRAAAYLRSIPRLRWVIVGGGNIEHYRASVRNFGLENRVILVGHKENPFPALQAMDVFTLLSTANEGISQSSLQAAYFSRPLITTTVGGLPEVCVDNQTGILVPPFSPSKVAEAVKRLKEDSSLCEKLGSRARELALSKYTMRATLEATEEIYKLLPLPTP